jgi:hypothetical protein
MYVVEATRWYGLFGGYLGPTVNQGRFDGGERSEPRPGLTMGANVSAGYTGDEWHAGLTADMRINSLNHARGSLFIVSGMAACEAGVLF